MNFTKFTANIFKPVGHVNAAAIIFSGDFNLAL